MSETRAAERIEAFGLSEDGKFARMKFGTDQEGGAIYVTLPVANVAEFYRELGKLVGTLKAAGKIKAPPVHGQSVRHCKVSRSNDPRLAGQTALLLDEGTPQEAMFVFADLDALKIADAIEQKVFKGKTHEQVDAMVKELDRPKIILPH